MKVCELKKYLDGYPDDTDILIYAVDSNEKQICSPNVLEFIKEAGSLFISIHSTDCEIPVFVLVIQV